MLGDVGDDLGRAVAEPGGCPGLRCVLGEHVTPEPTVGVARTDGLRLLYPGKEHAVIGEMESGKSWLALACVAAEIVRGNRVVYVHFEEADPGDTIERLRALGVRDDEILPVHLRRPG
jgi:hypothetical protein